MNIFGTRPARGARRSRSDAIGAGPARHRGIQIGKRIRVGGTLGKVGNAVKKGVGDVLDAGSTISIGGHKFSTNPAAPFMQAGAAKLRGQSDTGAVNAFKHGVSNNLRTAGVGAAVLGASAAVPAIMSAGVPSMGGAGAAAGKVLGRAGSAVMGRAGQIMNAGGGGGGGAEGEGMSWLDKILLGGSVAATAEDALRRRKMQDTAMDYSTGAYDARAPLRSRALQMLEHDQTPDHSAVFRDPGNVYDTQRRQLAIRGAA